MANNEASFLRRLFPTAHRRLLERILSRELTKVRGEVLVLGVGHDPYGHLLSSASSICRTDVDLYPSVDCIADAHDLPFMDGSFSSVVAIEVFEHLRSPNLAARELNRVLTPGGRAYLSIPFLFHIHGDPMDFNRFTAMGLDALFEHFSNVKISGFGGRVHVLLDIFTTSSKLLVPIRVINHFTSYLGLGAFASRDCPTGYWIELTK